MYLHLGNNNIIPINEIITILNISSDISEDVKDIIDTAKLDKKLINISEKDKAKSLIVCLDRVYVSPISSTTLYKRGTGFNKEV